MTTVRNLFSQNAIHSLLVLVSLCKTKREKKKAPENKKDVFSLLYNLQSQQTENAQKYLTVTIEYILFSINMAPKYPCPF